MSSGPPRVGSTNAATAEPPVPRPRTVPVVVPLFRDQAFRDFTPKTFSYTPPPPSTTGGPWGRIVLAADFSVTAGRQFDRTAQITVGGANVFFGTTAEPSARAGQSWHAERDVTDYRALLQSPHPGRVDLGNTVDATYTGVLRGSAALWFYPADAAAPPPTPDVVLPLTSPAGAASSLAAGADALAATFTCPTNTVRAYLDVITQSQHADEFWYTGVPGALAARLHGSGGTAFREAEISIDDRPVGVAPVFPWIYTGGIDPALWRPIPGVQTFSFTPYRVDLTPFAGVLSDGRPHRIALRVSHAADYFLATGTLLLFRDPHAARVSGAVTEDTLTAAPVPTVRQDIVDGAGGGPVGSVSVTSDRRFVIAGYVQTPQGRVETRIAQGVVFSNRQDYAASGRRSAQTIRQDCALDSVTTVRDGVAVRERRLQLDYPLTFATTAFGGQGGGAQTVTISQGRSCREQALRDGRLLFSSALTERVSPSDVTVFDAGGRPTARRGARSAQVYLYDDSRGGHVHRSLTAAGGALTSVAGDWEKE